MSAVEPLGQTAGEEALADGVRRLHHHPPVLEEGLVDFLLLRPEVGAEEVLAEAEGIVFSAGRVGCQLDNELQYGRVVGF